MPCCQFQEASGRPELEATTKATPNNTPPNTHQTQTDMPKKSKSTSPKKKVMSRKGSKGSKKKSPKRKGSKVTKKVKSKSRK